MRDHRKLRAFELADRIAVATYYLTKAFPKDEIYGLTAQMRRATVSIPSNIVEGCARTSQSDYRRFLEIAFGSLKELHYQASLANKLSYLDGSRSVAYESLLDEAEKVLGALIRSLRDKPI